MNVSLTPELENLVHEKVQSGLYTSASEVVREALRLLNDRDTVPQPRPALIDAGQNLAEALIGLIGVVHSDGSMDARDSQRVLGEYLEEKYQSGTL